MKNIDNQTLRNLEFEEWNAIIECCKILEKGFKKRMYGVQVRPNQAETSDVFGLMFSFDLTEGGYK